MVIGFARLNIDVPHFNDAGTSINKKWLPHYNTQGYEGSWDVLTLRSPGGDADNINAELLGNDAYADTPNMEAFPLVKKLIDTLHCDVMTVRLLNLKAGAVIKQHRDFELAFEKGEARLHFPVATNNAVEFYVNDLRVSMLPGECWYINANLPHRVANYGSTDRIHLVVDCKVNNWLTDVFTAAEKTEFEEPVNLEQTLRVIQGLRMHQTETANNLADKLELELKSANLI
ncbi:MAG: aspartyl/asparaginyl beta-hydroxylase domain-containing protein [Mucilaginibacter sp.]|uniref:aspartyl/asparaginyl beta-hydroxylase domain-containing protein n=1 Tax=Mucilaginibacter sp. TaxID=1882438 RepID=UPI003262E6DA